MDVRRIAAAAALPCLCLSALATHASAEEQRRRTAYRPSSFELRPTTPPPLANDQRVRELSAQTPAHSGMVESVTVGDTEVGLGRYAVGSIARPRSNLERERMMERENRNIAGAGMRVRF